VFGTVFSVSLCDEGPPVFGTVFSVSLCDEGPPVFGTVFSVSLCDDVGLSERLFSQLESSTKNERHELKLMMTNLISRLVGIHQVHPPLLNS